MNNSRIENHVQNATNLAVGVSTFSKKTPLLTSVFVGIRSMITNFNRRICLIVMRASMCGVIVMIFSGLKPIECRAFTQVTISTSAPQGIESTFIAATTNQFQASYFKNPLAANTYALKLFGFNPNFNPPVTNAMLLNALVTVDTYTYVYGWAGGVSYQQTVEEGVVGNYGNLCDTATSFMLVQMTSPTWSKGTCQDVITTIINQLYQMSLSTTPVLGF